MKITVIANWVISNRTIKTWVYFIPWVIKMCKLYQFILQHYIELQLSKTVFLAFWPQKISNYLPLMCVTLSANKWASALHQDMAGVAIYANVAAAQAGCHTLARLAAGAAISLPLTLLHTTWMALTRSCWKNRNLQTGFDCVQWTLK